MDDLIRATTRKSKRMARPRRPRIWPRWASWGVVLVVECLLVGIAAFAVITTVVHPGPAQKHSLSRKTGLSMGTPTQLPPAQVSRPPLPPANPANTSGVDRIEQLSLRRFDARRRRFETNARLLRLEGDVVLINIWASWCAPCRDELPVLALLARQLQRRSGFRYLSLTADGVPEKISPVLPHLGTDVFLAPPSVREMLAGKTRADKLPITIVLDSKGKVRLRLSGSLLQNDRGKKALSRLWKLRFLVRGLVKKTRETARLANNAGVVSGPEICVRVQSQVFCAPLQPRGDLARAWHLSPAALLTVGDTGPRSRQQQPHRPNIHLTRAGPRDLQ